MSTAFLDRVLVEDISTQARQVEFGRTVLTVLAAIFYAIGWTVGALWLAAAWAGVAVKLGFAEARSSGGRRAGPS